MRKRTGTAKPRAPHKPRALAVNMQAFEAANRAAEISMRAVLDGVIAPKIERCSTWSQSFEASSAFFQVKAGGVTVNVRYQFTFRYQSALWHLAVIARTEGSEAEELSVADASVNVQNIGGAVDVRSLLSVKDAASLSIAQMRHARGNLESDDPDEVPF